jgi:hypothetical protein
MIEWRDTNDAVRAANYIIPREFDCHTGYKFTSASTPIGPKPQNLNKVITYDDGLANQLEKWTAAGYLKGNYPIFIEYGS